MSSIILTINNLTATLPINFGSFTVNYNDGNITIPLVLRLASSNRSGQFEWRGVPNNGINGSALNYADGFNRDFRNVGGNNNLLATVTGNNQITVTSTKGTFISTTANSNVGSLSSTINNVIPVDPLIFSVLIQSVGDCNQIEYIAVATGGSQPLTLRNGNAILQSNWNGSVATFNLNRSSVNNINVTDSLGTTRSEVVNVPRTYKEGDFDITTIQYDGYSDLSVRLVNSVFGTVPLQYALTSVDAITGADYQLSPDFTGIFEGQYKVWLKDKYDCEVSRILEVRDLEDNTTLEIPRFFLVPEANALSFSDVVNFGGDVRKNYFNTRSGEENIIGRPVRIEQSFFDYHEIATRFLSSYPFHIVTLFKCDGSKKNIVPIMVQENLGSVEKIDCKLFNVNGSIGVYFDGGNEYEPNTNEVIGSNELVGFIPDWAVIGQLIFIDGLGGKYITGEGFDENRGYYFIIDGITADDLEAKVQTTFNKHIYNVWDMFLFMSDVDTSAYIQIEYGYSFNEIVGVSKSELIVKVEDIEDWHLIKWGDEKNIGDMIYQEFPQPFILLKGFMDAIYSNSSETSVGDASEYSLNQESFLGFSFRAGRLSQKMVNKLNLAAGTSLFEIDGIGLVKNSTATVENLGKTSLKTWSCEFGYSGNQLGIQEDEILLNVSTGVIGSGGSEFPELGEAPVFDGKTRYVDISGNFFTIDGNFISSN